MRLALLHPVVDSRSCSDCEKFLYDDRGQLLRRGGNPVPRPTGTRTPCATCPKIPPGESPDPSSAAGLTPQNREMWRFYQECRAVNSFPSDPIVRWAARTIRQAEDHAERVMNNRTQLTVLNAIRGA